MATTLDWYGCATFRLSYDGGPVVFLDAYLDRVEGAAGPQPPQRPEDVSAADWIVIGHSHFDHLWGAERIARQTGATIIGSYETIRVMAAQGVPEAQLMPVAGGERIRLADDLSVSVFPSLHSCVWVDLKFQQPDEGCIGDLGVTHQERLERFARLRALLGNMTPDVVAHLAASNQEPRGDGGALVFLI